MNFPLMALLLSLTLTPARAGYTGGRPSGGDTAVSEETFRDDMLHLRLYLAKRGEDPRIIDEFLRGIERRTTRMPSRDVLAAFLKYESAWARKTRDAKNPEVPKDKLAEEIRRSAQMRDQFKALALSESPSFFRAYQDSARELGRQHSDLNPRQGAERTGYFGDQIDNAYTLIDAGDAALEDGDPAAAAALATQALSINPGNADAFVLRAGADLDLQNPAAASQDALAALRLDPGNPQAKAVISLAGGPSGMNAALAPAATQALARAGGSAKILQGAAAPSRPIPPSMRRLDQRAPPPSPLPALGARLSADLTSQAARNMGANPAASIEQLDSALTLNPRNSEALALRSLASSAAGSYSDAQASANASLAADPGNAQAHYGKAFALAGAGDRDGALREIRAAAEIDPAFSAAAAAAAKVPTGADMTEAFVDPLAGVYARASQPKPRRAKKAGWSFKWPELQPFDVLKIIGLAMLAALLFAGRQRFFGEAA